MFARLRHHSFWSFEKKAACKAFASLATTEASPSHSALTHLFKPNHSAFALPNSSSTLRFICTTSRNGFMDTKMNGTNGTVRAKRKQHPSSAAERPQKQHRPINGKDSAGQNTPEVSSIFEDETEIEEPRLLAAIGDTAEWQATIEKVVRNVVSIRFCQTCSFDTDPALTSEATGFVVDAERGLVSTDEKMCYADISQIHYDQPTRCRIGPLLGILHL